MNKKAETGTLALCIALFPPLWAVLAPYLHVETGTVALICAGFFAANGNKHEDAVKISIGFLIGDLWAWLALTIIQSLNWNGNLGLFITLFVLGGLAVILSSFAPKWIYCPAWLCGWAIGLMILAPIGITNISTYPVQIGTAMLVGVWYVGVFLDILQKKMLDLCNRVNKKEEGEKINE